MKPTANKLSIFKALAIKLKKELVKTRDELQKLRDEHKATVSDLRHQLKVEHEQLESERLIFNNTNATQEALIKSLQTQLASAEDDLQAIQTEFEDYKTRATKIMQQNNPVQLAMQSNKGFEEERYKQLKELTNQYKTKVAELNMNLGKLSTTKGELENEVKDLSERLEHSLAQVDERKNLELKVNELKKENERLKLSLDKNDSITLSSNGARKYPDNHVVGSDSNGQRDARLRALGLPVAHTELHPDPLRLGSFSSGNPGRDNEIGGDTQLSLPSTSFSIDEHSLIKSIPSEIISQSFHQGNAQKQMDDLRKAYLNSENTSSLLTEQVSALKEELRRFKRGTERMDLIENLEYLKNIVLKFLSLDSSQIEQRQRLVPVLSTVLRLSPDEIAKLDSIATANRTLTSSLFRL